MDFAANLQLFFETAKSYVRNYLFFLRFAPISYHFFICKQQFLWTNKALFMKRLSSSYEKTRLFTERGRQKFSDDLITKLFAYLD